MFAPAMHVTEITPGLIPAMFWFAAGVGLAVFPMTELPWLRLFRATTRGTLFCAYFAGYFGMLAWALPSPGWPPPPEIIGPCTSSMSFAGECRSAPPEPVSLLLQARIGTAGIAAGYLALALIWFSAWREQRRERPA